MLSLEKLSTIFIASILSLSGMTYAVANDIGKESANSSNRNSPALSQKSTDKENNESSNNDNEKVAFSKHQFDHKAVFGGGHWNDYSISTVPEPEIYAMLVAGISLLGFVARRKKNPAHH